MDAISRLCKSTIVLNNGSILFNGESNEAISHYLKGEKGTYAYRSWIGLNNTPGNHFVKLRDVCILNQCGQISEVLMINEPIYIKFSYEVIVDEIEFTHGLNLHNQSGIHILSSHDLNTSSKKLKFYKGIYEASLEIPKNFLAEGLHQISIAIMSYNPFSIHFHEIDAAIFTVVDTIDGTTARGKYGGSFPGVVRPILFWESKKIS
jgi:lipopolysaccharide transport system ATP-binding protein